MEFKSGFALREIAGEKVVTAEGLENINFNKLIALNETAADIWKNFYGKTFEVADVASFLVDEYGIDMELAMNDSAKICNSWIDAGVLDK